MGMLAAKGAGVMEETGQWTFLWAKVASFVVNRGMETAGVLESASSKHATSMSAPIKAFADWWEFTEALNLFILFATRKASSSFGERFGVAGGAARATCAAMMSQMGVAYLPSGPSSQC